jgi:hypothetical protein
MLMRCLSTQASDSIFVHARPRATAVGQNTAPAPAMPEWSPGHTFGGYGARTELDGAGKQAVPRDLKSFWGALGCAC